jgi:hypothetical protein
MAAYTATIPFTWYSYSRTRNSSTSLYICLSLSLMSSSWATYQHLTIRRCMGTTAANRTLEVDYPLAFTTAFTSAGLTKPFRHIHLSGATTERNQTSNLWFKSEMRKMKVSLLPLLLFLLHTSYPFTSTTLSSITTT